MGYHDGKRTPTFPFIYSDGVFSGFVEGVLNCGIIASEVRDVEETDTLDQEQVAS